MENVRVTVQIRDEKNRVRVTMHKDTVVSQIEVKAQAMAKDAATFFHKQRKVALAEAGEKGTE